jgi:hypothetical protein
MAAKDLTRQIVVISAFCFMIIAALVGTGFLGGEPVEDTQGGNLDSDASYLAPAGPAFSIWSVIYVGLFAYTVWQAFPRQRERSRQRAVGWLIAGTMALNGLWLVAAQFGSLPLTVLAIFLLLALLAVTFRRTVVMPGRGWVDSLLIDGVTGLHLGWVTLASVANTAAWLTTIVPEEAADAATAWGIAVLVVVGVIGVAIAWASEWRIAPALALVWGLSWLAFGRLADEPQNAAIGVTAIIVAAVVLLVSLVGTVVYRAAEVRNAGA